MKDTSPPAFPVICENGLGHISDGMTIRQYYAARGPASYERAEQAIRKSGVKNPNYKDVLNLMASINYVYADIMIEKGKKGQSDETN